MKLTEEDLRAFQEAVYKDYGVKIPDDKLYESAFNLLSFFEALIRYDQEDKAKIREADKEQRIENEK